MLGANINVKGYMDGIKNLSEAGYKYVHFDGDFLVDVKTSQMKDVSQIINDSGLEPFSLHDIWMYPEDKEKINDFVSYKESVFERAKILNVRYLTFHFGFPVDLKDKEDFEFEKYLNRKGIKQDDFRKMNIEMMRTLCKKAEEYGLSLTIENLPPRCLGGFTTTVEDILNIIREIDTPNLGICFDSGHGNIAGINLLSFILKAGDKLFETHFHDNLGYLKDDNSINDLHQPCGIGNINWIEVIAGLERINFKNPIIFEIGSSYETLNINKNNWFTFYAVYKNRLKNYNLPYILNE